jgi:hypothetical protein
MKKYPEATDAQLRTLSERAARLDVNLKTPSTNGAVGSKSLPGKIQPVGHLRPNGRPPSDSGESVSPNHRLRRRPVKREAARAALIALYPHGLPDNKVTVVIWNSVNRRLRELGKQPVSQETIQRALRDFTKSRDMNPTR